jgi:hypothetical protein
VNRFDQNVQRFGNKQIQDIPSAFPSEKEIKEMKTSEPLFLLALS